MQYMMLLYSNESGWNKLDTDAQNTWIKAYQKYFEELSAAGVFVEAHHFQTASMTRTVTVKDGKPFVSNAGVFDSPIQLAGYFTINVPDQETAISWAVKHPAAKHGLVEVRALNDTPSAGESSTSSET